MVSVTGFSLRAKYNAVFDPASNHTLSLAIRFLLGSSVRSAFIRSHSPTLFIHFSRPLVYVLEDAVHGLCSCSSFSGSCFRPFRRYVSFRNFCVGGQSIHVTFSTRAADMYTDMPIVDRGATATSGIRAQNATSSGKLAMTSVMNLCMLIQYGNCFMFVG